MPSGPSPTTPQSEQNARLSSPCPDARVLQSNPELQARQALPARLKELGERLDDVVDAGLLLSVNPKNIESALSNLRVIQTLLVPAEQLRGKGAIPFSVFGVLPTMFRFAQAAAVATGGTIGNPFDLIVSREAFCEAREKHLDVLTSCAQKQFSKEIDTITKPVSQFMEVTEAFYDCLKRLEADYSKYLDGSIRNASKIKSQVLAPIKDELKIASDVASLQPVKLSSWRGMHPQYLAHELCTEFAQLAPLVDILSQARDSTANNITQGLNRFEQKKIERENQDRSRQELEVSQAAARALNPATLQTSPQPGSRLAKVFELVGLATEWINPGSETNCIAITKRAESLWIGLGQSGQTTVARHLDKLVSDGHIDPASRQTADKLVETLRRKPTNGGDGITSDVTQQELVELALGELGLRIDEVPNFRSLDIDYLDRVISAVSGMGIEPAHFQLLFHDKPDILGAKPDTLRKELLPLGVVLGNAFKVGVKVEAFSSLADLLGALDPSTSEAFDRASALE